MADPLTHAMRARDLSLTLAILTQMQQSMSPGEITNHILVRTVRLAWEEGDAAAARWLLYHGSSWLDRCWCGR
ncbi:MAG: hypothetical protein IGQ88_01295 [Gloeomargaritaceae cyanobacterium C42_A2020_066]|nr:hypothetical protein [Gloeomargaritaceae cyanobacterium C42_A2020_066]